VFDNYYYKAAIRIIFLARVEASNMIGETGTVWRWVSLEGLPVQMTDCSFLSLCCGVGQ
jgi:hypothetical protein